MRFFNLKILFLFILISSFIGCANKQNNSQQGRFRQKSELNEYPQFSSYNDAIKFYLKHFKNDYDSMKPDSTAVTMAVYFPESQRKVMLIVFHGNPNVYIYEGVSASIWHAFKNAGSKGRYYYRHIKGHFNFRL